MQFKEWLLKQETAGDSWGVPTAQPVLWMLRAHPEGAPLQGVMNLEDFPPGSIKNPFKASLSKRLERYYKKNKTKNDKQLDMHSEVFIRQPKDTVYMRLLKYFLKYRDKLPRPQEFKDAPDQYTTAGYDDVGAPDTGQRAYFKVLPHYT